MPRRYRAEKEMIASEVPGQALQDGVYRIPSFRICLIRETMEAGTQAQIGGPRDVARIMSHYLAGYEREVLAVLLLDTKNKVIGLTVASIGDLSSSIVHPREVFKPAIVASASSIIVSHNHPSGDPTPSSEDVGVTRRLMQAGEIIGIDLLDHIVIGNGSYSPSFVSLKERGMI